MFIDTHAHLTDSAFEGRADQIISHAKECSVEKIITSGAGFTSSLAAAAFASKYDGVFCTIGIYPENIYELDDNVCDKMREIAAGSKVVGIGEIGLQYTEDAPERSVQKAGFLRQIELAKELGLPIVIHCRDAIGDMIELLKQNKQLLSNGGTYHCFSGSEESAKEIIKLGLHISMGGVSTFKNAQRLRDTLAKVPLEHMLLETDCPYLAPHPYRGQTNTPAYIPNIAENLAKIKGVTVEKVAEVTTENARRLFGI